MSTYYFEVRNNRENRERGIVFYCDGEIPIKAQYKSCIIWKESENEIVFVKHRYREVNSELTPEDIDEFLWAKLKAREYDPNHEVFQSYYG